MKKLLLFLLVIILNACAASGRISSTETDNIVITDDWTKEDINIAVSNIMSQLENHIGLQEHIKNLGKKPKIFIKEIRNDTKDYKFRITDLNNTFLRELSKKNIFTIVNRRNLDLINDEIKYQNLGTIKKNEVSSVINESGADILIFGQITLNTLKHGNKRLKEYNLTISLTDTDTKEEIAILEYSVTKYIKGGFF